MYNILLKLFSMSQPFPITFITLKNPAGPSFAVYVITCHIFWGGKKETQIKGMVHGNNKQFYWKCFFHVCWYFLYPSGGNSFFRPVVTTMRSFNVYFLFCILQRLS
jgi:hypothetical protein